MCWKSKVVEVRKLPANWPISYGSTFYTSVNGYVGILPVGYADGLNRVLSGKIQFAHSETGECYNQIGRITMDHSMVWLGESDIPVGTSIDILNGKAESAKKWAKKINTIPYEVVCGISKRVKRQYK
jgi:alanine racemase